MIISMLCRKEETTRGTRKPDGVSVVVVTKDSPSYSPLFYELFLFFFLVPFQLSYFLIKQSSGFSIYLSRQRGGWGAGGTEGGTRDIQTKGSTVGFLGKAGPF